jgi:hypothetical protein
LGHQFEGLLEELFESDSTKADFIILTIVFPGSQLILQGIIVSCLAFAAATSICVGSAGAIRRSDFLGCSLRPSLVFKYTPLAVPAGAVLCKYMAHFAFIAVAVLAVDF